MRDTHVKLKDGRSFSGPLWLWRPKEGWFSLSLPEDNQPNPENRIYLADIESGYHEKMWEHADEGPVDVDVLERAKKHGWAP